MYKSKILRYLTLLSAQKSGDVTRLTHTKMAAEASMDEIGAVISKSRKYVGKGKYCVCCC